VYVDQSGMGDDERPPRGYSKKGTLCIGKKPAFTSLRRSMMAGLCNKKIIAPVLYDCTCTAVLVETWLLLWLLPTIAHGSVLIMDNAAFHRKTTIEKLAAQFQCTVLWLPPYSPEHNDIEPWWAIIKRYARKFMALHENATIDAALDYAFGIAP